METLSLLHISPHLSLLTQSKYTAKLKSTNGAAYFTSSERDYKVICQREGQKVGTNNSIYQRAIDAWPDLFLTSLWLVC